MMSRLANNKQKTKDGRLVYKAKYDDKLFIYSLRWESDCPEMATTPLWLRSSVVSDASETKD
jgi:hypothetical protein